jgi:hypothetical protein
MSELKTGNSASTCPVGKGGAHDQEALCLLTSSIWFGLVNVPNLTTLCEQNASRNGYLIITHSVPIYWRDSTLL